jgi:hypothetical protein
MAAPQSPDQTAKPEPGVPLSPAKQRLDERLDQELKETFPASDPIPWTHHID